MEMFFFGGYNHAIITNIFWDHDVGTPTKRNFGSSYYCRTQFIFKYTFFKVSSSHCSYIVPAYIVC